LCWFFSKIAAMVSPPQVIPSQSRERLVRTDPLYCSFFLRDFLLSSPFSGKLRLLSSTGTCSFFSSTSGLRPCSNPPPRMCGISPWTFPGPSLGPSKFFLLAVFPPSFATFSCEGPFPPRQRVGPFNFLLKSSRR